MVLIGAGALTAGAFVLVACSSDTSVEAKGDSGTDGGGGGEGGGGNLDGGADTSPPFDGGFKVDTFDKVLATEICNTTAKCCYGTATPAPDGGADGGTFDRAQCESIYLRLGFEGSNNNNQLKDGGKLALDQSAADNCINLIKSMKCSLDGADFKTIRAACFSAYAGTGGTGAACAASIECQKDFFCKAPDGGATGTCEAVRATDAGCGDFTSDPSFSDQACSYRAGGNTGNFCKWYDFGTGTQLPPAAWRCTPSGGVGTRCQTSLWCNATICNDNSDCVSPEKYFDSACSAFSK